jgi:hypothetical protein
LEIVAKRAKIGTSKLKLKAQNLYNKPLLKPSNIYNKQSVETACVCENLLSKKEPKVAEMSQFCPICGLYYKSFMIVIYDLNGSMITEPVL